MTPLAAILLLLCWQGRTNAVYEVQQTPDLTRPKWALREVTVQTNLSVEANTPSAFFRVLGRDRFTDEGWDCKVAILPPPQPRRQSVTLAWDASPDPTVTGYNAYYGAASGGYTNMVQIGNATSATVEHLAGGVTYYFVVTAYNDIGMESDPSNEVCYRTPE